MPRIRIRGVGLHVEEHGQGRGILCVHGTGSSAAAWRPAAIEALSGLGRLVVYDRRGFSRSERPEPHDPRVEGHADDAAALLDALGAAPAVVVGRSYGGLTAISLALRHPASVRALVVMEAPLLSLDREAAAFGDELRTVVEAAAAVDPSSVGEAFLRRILAAGPNDELPPPVREMFADNSASILAEVAGSGLAATVDDLARIDVPTLLVAGEASPSAFRRVTQVMAEAIPGARTLLVGGGHLIDPSDPEIVTFVREVLGGPAR